MAKKSTRVGPYTTAVKAENQDVKVCTDKDGFLYGLRQDGTIAWQETRSGKNAKQIGQRRSHKMSGDARYEVFDKDGNAILIPYAPSMLKNYQRFWPYMEEVALELARRVGEGDALKAVCAEPDMPPFYIVMKWQAQVPEFKAMLREARAMRAESFHDDIMQAAYQVDEDTSKSAKVKIDALKHLAAVGDPDTYGSKTKITGDVNAPLSFVFQTGIDRNTTADVSKLDVAQEPAIEVPYEVKEDQE